MYDLIGDLHGHADELVQMLRYLGYMKESGVYRHPERKVIFLGDFIDRGSQIRQVLEIVRSMVDAGRALAILGNHELNALAYHTRDADSPGEFLRPHTPKNQHQHRKTLEQLSGGELTSYLDWFRKLPMWLELRGLRAIHACWDDPSIECVGQSLRSMSGVTDTFLQSACKSGNELFEAVETILKGKEAALPESVFICDKDGQMRAETRVRWYLSPVKQTYRTYALTDVVDCDVDLDPTIADKASPYPPHAKPVFIGHYWMKPARPEILAPNVACLDYSVAKGGFLCAYRWNGEETLKNENFAYPGAELVF
jgi:hypothetical protein